MKFITAQVIAHKINQLVPDIKSGTLRFYGEWFGRPMDNHHRIIKADYQEHLLIIYFDNNESLYINYPEEFLVSKDVFTIRKSKGLVWKWYSYGEEQINKNLKVNNYKVMDEEITSIKLEGQIYNKFGDGDKLAIEIC